jgi:hypothetical protein
MDNCSTVICQGCECVLLQLFFIQVQRYDLYGDLPNGEIII